MPHGGKAFLVGAELCRWLASSGLLDWHLTNGTSELQPVGPLTPDSLVNVVNTGLEFPFKSNFIWPFVPFFSILCKVTVLFMVFFSNHANKLDQHCLYAG